VENAALSVQSNIMDMADVLGIKIARYVQERTKRQRMTRLSEKIRFESEIPAWGSRELMIENKKKSTRFEHEKMRKSSIDLEAFGCFRAASAIL
jgi:hypothetical protein